MTKVTFFQNKDSRYKGFIAFDHSGYADAGEDLVCAGISALVINCVNSIEELTEDDFDLQMDEKSGMIHLTLEDKHSNEAELLMKSLVIGLTKMEEEAQEFIDIIFEEV